MWATFKAFSFPIFLLLAGCWVKPPVEVQEAKSILIFQPLEWQGMAEGFSTETYFCSPNEMTLFSEDLPFPVVISKVVESDPSFLITPDTVVALNWETPRPPVISSSKLNGFRNQGPVFSRIPFLMESRSTLSGFDATRRIYTSSNWNPPPTQPDSSHSFRGEPDDMPEKRSAFGKRKGAKGIILPIRNIDSPSESQEQEPTRKDE